MVTFDHDPLVVTHARALLATDELVTVINGDVREYETILSAPELGALIDLAKPVCVPFVSVLHFVAVHAADAAGAASTHEGWNAGRIGRKRP